MGDGVIGNTFGFGPNVEGSSPSPPAEIGRAMSGGNTLVGGSNELKVGKRLRWNVEVVKTNNSI